MQSKWQSIGLMCLAMALFAITFALLQVSMGYLPRAIVLFFQSLFSLAVLLPLILSRGIRDLYSKEAVWLLLRGVAGLVGMFCIVTALRVTSLAETTLLNNTAPLFVPFLAFLMLREPIDLRLWPGIVLGFVGVALIVQPGFHRVSSGHLFALASGVTGALVLILSRRVAHEPLVRITAYYYGLFVVATAPFALGSTWDLPPVWIWLALVLCGVVAVAAISTLALALRKAHTQEVAAFVYTGVLFALLIDGFVWNRIPTPLAWVGIVTVCCGGIWTLLVPRKEAH
jgi:drug/metabolite transporter (DMT)-like permease